MTKKTTDLFWEIPKWVQKMAAVLKRLGPGIII